MPCLSPPHRTYHLHLLPDVVSIFHAHHGAVIRKPPNSVEKSCAFNPLSSSFVAEHGESFRIRLLVGLPKRLHLLSSKNFCNILFHDCVPQDRTHPSKQKDNEVYPVWQKAWHLPYARELAVEAYNTVKTVLRGSNFNGSQRFLLIFSVGIPFFLLASSPSFFPAFPSCTPPLPQVKAVSSLFVKKRSLSLQHQRT